MVTELIIGKRYYFKPKTDQELRDSYTRMNCGLDMNMRQLSKIKYFTIRKVDSTTPYIRTLWFNADNSEPISKLDVYVQGYNWDIRDFELYNTSEQLEEEYNKIMIGDDKNGNRI